jgi:alpha,alpha-trehalase
MALRDKDFGSRRRLFRMRSCDTCLRRIAAAGFAFVLAATPLWASGTPQSSSAERGLEPIRSYIASGWDSLTRSMTDCKSVVDTKLATPSVLYLPADFDPPDAVQQLQKQCKVEVRHLPTVIHHLGEIDTEKIDPAGLLYLPSKYVVPGGRFNEMYGWDSYFIIRGLVRDNQLDLAQGMVENFFFEIAHYGAVLNANRTYYLTRSQPPFLTSMILAVYEARKAAGNEDRTWLKKAYGYAVRDHALWINESHLAGSTGLARYYDFGNGPAPESLKDETGHLEQVAAYFLSQPGMGRGYIVQKRSSGSPQTLVGPLFALQVCGSTGTMANSQCSPSGSIALAAEYYKGDRAMRESGYDISFRFGPFGASTHHFAPVCLNSLLYKTEQDLAQMSEILGDKKSAEQWRKHATERRDAIQNYLWDAKRGLYFDYDFEKQVQSSYEYVTTFVPMWAGVATPEQAGAIVKNLGVFERPGGLAMSPRETGGQWDYPYAWAPNQLLADEGMRRYGFNEEADRSSYEFLSAVAENFRRDGTIREKYNAATRSSETQVTAGYHVNIVGFGWTNGVFLELLHQLPEKLATRLAQEQNSTAATSR